MPTSQFKTPLETERLRIRRFHKSDVFHLREMLADPLIMKYYGPQAKDQTPEEWFTAVEAGHEKQGSSFLAVALKATGEFIGQAGILYKEIEGVPDWEVAYMFKKEFWGKGFASEATRACMRYAYQHLNPRRFISIINPKNELSIKLARRNGMEFERMAFKWGMDVAVYAINLDHWKKLHGQGL